MADWSKPTITSNYVTFVDEVKNRDIDAITLQVNALTNPPVSAIKLLRSPAKFQEWNGSAFVDIVLSVAGGGTGSSTPGGAVSGLGLGTMSLQNANAVAITGGTASGLNLSNTGSTGSFYHTGAGFNVQSTATGTVALAATGIAGAYALYVVGADSPGASYGTYIVAGTGTDYALAVINRAQNRHGLLVNGNMVAQFPWRMIIPVGADYWA